MHLLIFFLIINFLITILTVPKVKNFGLFYTILDKPNKRKQHSNPVVRIGGIAMLLPFIISILFIYLLSKNPDIPFNPYIFYILLSAIFFNFIGLMDDLFTLRPIIRLIIQSSLAFWIISKGICIHQLVFDLTFIGLPVQILELNEIFTYIFSLLWIVGLVNAFNWLDGLDGLAAGASLIISISFCIISLLNGHFDIALICISLVGICSGFLLFNRYPAKIMMGDGGSNLLGFLFSSISLLATRDNIQSLNINMSFIIFLIPVADMFFVIISRIKDKLSPFFPDRRHLHYRLLNIGFTHFQCVKQMYLYFFATSLLGISHQMNSYRSIFVTISILLLAINLYQNKNKYKILFKL